MRTWPLPPLASCKRVLASVFLGIAVSGCSIIPYADEFQCPGTYRGLCEEPLDAYRDSINGIEPHRYDAAWRQARKAWEANNPELMAVRATVSTFNNAAAEGAAAGYRELLFMRMREQMENPIVPELTPPETVRCLILDSLGRQDNSLYTPPHYVHFIIEQPRWAMKKISELQAHNRFRAGEDDYPAALTKPNPAQAAPGAALAPEMGQGVQGASAESPEMAEIRRFVEDGECQGDAAEK